MTTSAGIAAEGAAIRRRLPVAALLAANTISLAGNAITALAIPWYVLETTGSAARVGLVGFCAALPAVLAAFFGGAVVDRLGFKRSSIASDLLSGVTVALVPLLHQTVGLPFGGLLGLVFLGALLDAPGVTARQALFPDLVGLAGMRLEGANAAYQTVQRLSQFLGPALAGILIALLGASNVLWLDAATFAVSAGLIAASVPGTRSDPARGADAPGRAQAGSRYLAETLAELRFLWQDRLLRTLAMAVAVTNALDAPLFTVAVPVYARDVFGSATALGLMEAGFGAGAVTGALAFAGVGHRLPRRPAFVAGFALLSLPLWILATAPSLPVAVVANALVGLVAGPINPILMTVRQERVPAAMRGRVFGTFTAIALVAMPAGILLGGLVVERAGFAATIAVIAGGYLLASGAMLLAPVLRDMDRPRS